MLKDCVGEKIAYTRARWGGSFWHHDVESAQVRDIFDRRISRLLGMTPEVPASKPRVFVRLVSSTVELDLTMQLHQLLKEQLPASRIYLLMMADFQQIEETIILPDADVLLYRVHEHIFTASKNFTRSACCENYARALTRAVGIWCGSRCVDGSDGKVSTEASLSQAIARFNQMDSGDPGSEVYCPRRFRGQRIKLDRPLRMPALFTSTEEEFAFPHDVSKGSIAQFNAFGIPGIQIELTDDAVAGQSIVLSQATDGTITAALLISAAVPTAAASVAIPAVDGTTFLDAGATDVGSEQPTASAASVAADDDT